MTYFNSKVGIEKGKSLLFAYAVLYVCNINIDYKIMLYTNLKHIENDVDFEKAIDTHFDVVVCCGDMGYRSINVYKNIEKLVPKMKHVSFYDMEFGNPILENIRAKLNCDDQTELPFILHFRNAKLNKRLSVGLNEKLPDLKKELTL